MQMKTLMTSLLYVMYQSFMWIFGKFKCVIKNICIMFITWYHILSEIMFHYILYIVMVILICQYIL